MSKPTPTKPMPPKHSQFKKGQSGNPKGRPKKIKEDKPQSSLDIVIDKKLTITRNGVQQSVSVEEALQHKTLMNALAGDRTARREVVKMIREREQALAKAAKPPKLEIPPAIVERELDNANAALVHLGIAAYGKPDPLYQQDEQLKLESWATQAALKRRRGGNKLSLSDVYQIRRCTRGSDTLRWPRGTQTEDTQQPSPAKEKLKAMIAQMAERTKDR